LPGIASPVAARNGVTARCSACVGGDVVTGDNSGFALRALRVWRSAATRLGRRVAVATKVFVGRPAWPTLPGAGRPARSTKGWRAGVAAGTLALALAAHALIIMGAIVRSRFACLIFIV
jgi:hypothetical protein